MSHSTKHKAKTASRAHQSRRSPEPKLVIPTLPEHNLPEPYARLMRLSRGEYPETYEAVAREAAEQSSTDEAVQTLLALALDETYYDYGSEEDEWADPRAWTSLHALRTLERFGPAAAAAVEPMLGQLYTDDDYVMSELPRFFGAIGEAAVEPLRELLNDLAADTDVRIGAAEAIGEIGERNPETRDRVVAILEKALAVEEEMDVAGFIVSSLLDLGAVESYPIIQSAFAEDRVDAFVITLEDVEQALGLPRSRTDEEAHASWRRTSSFQRPSPSEARDDYGAGDVAEDDEAPPQPYVAPAKVGRNEPCPCGSGKKYKKCCGASA